MVARLEMWRLCVKSFSGHLPVAGVVSWYILVQFLGHACKEPTGLLHASWDF